MKGKPTILDELRRACVRYGLEPEVIGPANAETFAGDQYMADYLRFMKFSRLAFAPLLFADIGQAFEYIGTVPDLVDGQPFSQNLFGSRPVL
jgi:hypothetical protein